MNLCFVIGKVVTDTEFNFLCDKKYTSIAKCNIELSNKSVIEEFVLLLPKKYVKFFQLTNFLKNGIVN